MIRCRSGIGRSCNEPGRTVLNNSSLRNRAPEIRVFNGTPQVGLQGQQNRALTIPASLTFGNSFVNGVNLTLGELEQVEIDGDPDRLKQLLLNLVDNALRHTAAGGDVTLDLLHEARWAVLRVHDTGVGIAAEDHEAVFEEFRQVGTDYAKKHEGTGLGLTLSRRFVELHGGRIWVKSELNQGATFTFTLPVGPWRTS